jgi:hypothetical protein
LTDAERLPFPRAESSSDAATHAPRASFQIVRYVLFISNHLSGMACAAQQNLQAIAGKITPQAKANAAHPDLNVRVAYPRGCEVFKR